MRAIVCTEWAPPEALRLQELPEPEPAEGQALVAIRAAGLNFVDGLLVQGLYQIRIPPPFIPGGDLAGEVIATRGDCGALVPGDRVLASPGIGAFAERIALPAGSLLRMPANLGFEAGAVFLQAHATAVFALRERGGLRAGETLLVLGAAGGTGAAAVQIGKAMGARVVACAAGEQKLAACRALGADATIDYASGDFRAALKETLGRRGTDLVFDPVGGALSEPALRSCAENGRYLVIGFASGEIPRIALNLPLLKSCQIVGVDWGGFAGRHPDGARQVMEHALALRADGKITDPPLARYPLADAARALGDLAARRVVGKAVLEIAP